MGLGGSNLLAMGEYLEGNRDSREALLNSPIACVCAVVLYMCILCGVL